MLLVAVQLSVPAGVSLTVTGQLYVPSLFGVQPLDVGSKLEGDTLICGGLHLHETVAELLPCPEKVILALARHVVLGTVIDTDVGCCPAIRVPLDELMAMPLIPLLDAFQFRIP